MATINQRTLADGRARYWVKWRLGGTRGGAPQSEPFDTRAGEEDLVQVVGGQHPVLPQPVEDALVPAGDPGQQADQGLFLLVYGHPPK
ncbi:hypothetical protein NE857_09925 [Nocardiopsis exhalans]|uniref:Uncharacterized protein n=1 Tax=Nocardiopsis exhalans TaxID=163604 RepID=A0ABY5DCY9_9ACTN|nr:hypothetical protein [Nocardiopsis exhalans]USY21892.1 hypothetical protein NE857_09925 [Nocardiopsis exhalans]